MLREIIRIILSLLAAMILSCCFPSGNFSCFAFIALVPLILVAEESGAGASFWRGYFAGFVFFAVTLFWIVHVTAVGLVLLSAYLALYWGVFFAAVSRISSWPLVRRMFFLPALWVLLEYVRAHAFTGFGWVSLAHTQSSNIPLIRIAAFTGIYGVSYVVFGINVIVSQWVAAVLRRSKVSCVLGGVTAAVAAGFLVLAGGYHAPVSAGMPFRVALIQPNISLVDYRDYFLKPYVVEKHLALSREAMKDKPQMIVWPETAFPQFIWEYPELFEKVSGFARENHVKLLLGAVTREKENYFNSAILINEEGAVAGTYNKQHLVLLGEYIPFRRELPWLARFVPIDDFTPGDKQGVMPLLIDTAQKPVSFAAMICFEDTLPEIARGAVSGGAALLVNLTNDAWFRDSRQPRMHLDNAVFRAVENHVPLVRATNTGMTCRVSPEGAADSCVADISGQSVMVEGVSVVDVRVGGRGRTFYTRFGDVFAGLCGLGVMVLALLNKPGFLVRQARDIAEV
ncbi:MAG: apolipoprotein N-acyltransferase [Candidatus Omnitrophota bacterium]